MLGSGSRLSDEDPTRDRERLGSSLATGFAATLPDLDKRLLRRQYTSTVSAAVGQLSDRKGSFRAGPVPIVGLIAAASAPSRSIYVGGFHAGSVRSVPDLATLSTLSTGAPPSTPGWSADMPRSPASSETPRIYRASGGSPPTCGVCRPPFDVRCPAYNELKSSTKKEMLRRSRIRGSCVDRRSLHTSVFKKFQDHIRVRQAQGRDVEVDVGIAYYLANV